MKHGKALGLQGRYNKLKPMVEQAYDLADMTKFVGRTGLGDATSAKRPAGIDRRV